MKLLCIITAFIVVLLSVRPCCADDCALKKQETTKTASSPSSEKECAGCSPFFSCGICVGFVLASPIVQAVTLNAEPVKHHEAYQQPYIEEIAASIWQPPQLG